MARLAIKGHKERGAEVITLLEMLGGINVNNLYGDETYYYYTVMDDEEIDGVIFKYSDDKSYIFSLEEFEEKFPYKVGDKVIYEDKRREITKMAWEEQTNTVAYKLDDKLYCNVVDELQPYKEETMEERKYADLRIDIDQDDKLATEVTIDGDKIMSPENYLIGKITKVDNGMLVEFVKKQPQYPKTYKECCEVLGYEPDEDEISCYKGDLIESFVKLLICRDAYWKIGGVPDVKSSKCCCLYYDITDNDIYKELGPFDINSILIFPTQEICDMFYANFKELIKRCKKLL